MPLITTIEQVRTILGSTVMQFNDNSSIADMAAAEERFIIPITGETLYDDMVADVDDEESPLQPLIVKAQRAIAPLAYWLDLPAIQGKISDRGAGTFISDNMQPLHAWEFERLREYLEDKGCFALESFLSHINANAVTYSWEKPTAYKSIFLTGKEFSEYYPLYQPHRVFELLRTVIKDVEDRFIRNLIGDDFFESLRDSASTDAEQAVVQLIKKSVANLAVATACKVLPVKITPQGFTVLLSDAGDKNYKGEAQAPAENLQALHNHCMYVGNGFLNKMKAYLDDNASGSVFADYYDSEYYVEPVDEDDVVSFNDNNQTFFL